MADLSRSEILTLQDDLRAGVRTSSSLEEAAQRAVGILYDALQESAVLVRLFATLPYADLPGDLQRRVSELACINGCDGAVHDEALVLTLLGTRGTQAAWNSRAQSVGHAGIPLVSAGFVEAIPMVSRLLRELGVDLRWFDDQDRSAVEKKLIGGLAGLFYVRDAASALDHRGRTIIPAQDFVAGHGVKTVFGLGSVYAGGTVLTLLVFTRDLLEKVEVEPYVRLVQSIKAATAALAAQRRWFAPPTPA
jgi:two-component system NtrC family sensor kinase